MLLKKLASNRSTIIINSVPVDYNQKLNSKAAKYYQTQLLGISVEVELNQSIVGSDVSGLVTKIDSEITSCSVDPKVLA